MCPNLLIRRKKLINNYVQLFIPQTAKDLKSDKTQQLWHLEEMIYKYVYLGRMYIQKIYSYLFWMIPKAIMNCWRNILYGIKESFLLKVVQFRVENNIMSVILISYCLKLLLLSQKKSPHFQFGHHDTHLRSMQFFFLCFI